MDDTARRIAALLADKQNMDANRDATLNMSVGSKAEWAWLLDAIALLLQAELHRNSHHRMSEEHHE